MILIVSIPDICVLPYFLYSHEYRLTRNTVYCAILSDQIVVELPIRCAYFILDLICNLYDNKEEGNYNQLKFATCMVAKRKAIIIDLSLQPVW